MLSLVTFGKLCRATRKGDYVRATRLWNIADRSSDSDFYFAAMVTYCEWAFEDPRDVNTIQFRYDDRERRKLDCMFARMLAGICLLFACLSIGCGRPDFEPVTVLGSVDVEYSDVGHVTEYHLVDGRVLIIKADHSEVIIKN